jgi:integrase
VEGHTGYVFTTPDGQPLYPDYLTRRFHRPAEQSGLPPVRLHELRHGAASLAHSAGADLKIVQEQLGHTSIVLTADTYTSVLTDKHHNRRSHRPARPGRSRPRPQTRQAAHQRSAVEVRCL